MIRSYEEFISDDVLRYCIKVDEFVQSNRVEERRRMLVENPAEVRKTVSFERPTMTERALMALEAYGRFGLSIRELYEKREVWLFFPDDELPWTISVKAVSMLLRRLDHRLADRRREGREWRYWINDGGRSRLAHYRKVREDSREERESERAYAQVCKINRKTIDEMIATNRKNLSTLKSSPESDTELFFIGYSSLWEHILQMAEALHTCQTALATGNPVFRELAFFMCTKSLTNLNNNQELLFVCMRPAKGSPSTSETKLS